MNVKKVKYDFDSLQQEKFKSEISYINKQRGIGFIAHQPENLYFHQAFLDEGVDFEKFDIGLAVEYLIGRNDEGEKIARKVRLVEK
jgi:cold shock CspA family protein